MKVEALTDFLNTVNLHELKTSLDELDIVAESIFSRTSSNLHDLFVEEVRGKNAKFFVWFCFLRANFLRGKDTISNRAFIQFVEFCRKTKNNYYFDSFPTKSDFLPHFQNPKFRYAPGVEEVFQQLKGRHSSGNEFAQDLEKTCHSFAMNEIH
jgi:hypothetical protein